MEKSKIYKDKKLKYIMNKKGAIEAVFVIFASVMIVGSVLMGSYVIDIEESSKMSNYNYVVNIETKQIYDFRCLHYIPQNNRIVFDNLDIAIREGYIYNKECPK